MLADQFVLSLDFASPAGFLEYFVSLSDLLTESGAPIGYQNLGL